MSDIDDLQKLAELRDRGVINQREFERKKNDILRGRSGKSSSRSKGQGLWWKIPLGLIGVIALFNALKTEPQTAPQNGSTATAFMGRNEQLSSPQQPPVPSAADNLKASIPRTQAAFLEAITSARQQYATAANDMAKGAARPARARQLCAALQGLSANNWVGKVSSLSTNGEGRGVLEIDIGSGATVKTWNNSLSDIADNTLIQPQSALFRDASRLKTEQAVHFDGTFISSQVDCVKESSLSLSGSIRSPEFIFVFRSISPLM